MTNTPGRAFRYVQMDALRGIAALLVVYSHTVEFRAAALLPASLQFRLWHMLNWGSVGVAAFFCISGFVIPYSFGKHEHAARSFVISRIARLYPAYWCSLLAGIVSVTYAGRHLPAITILANFTMAQQLFAQPDIWGVYWTLFIELLFYVVCLGAFLAGKLRSLVFLLAASIIFFVLSAANSRLAPAAEVPAMSLGIMLLASLWRRFIVEHDKQAARLTALGAVLWLAALFILSASVEESARTAESWICGVALFAVFSLLKARPPILLQRLGDISYGVYLYHELVSGIVKRLPAWANTPYSGFLCTAIGTIAIAALSYKFVERPSIRLGKSLAGREPVVAATIV